MRSLSGWQFHSSRFSVADVRRSFQAFGFVLIRSVLGPDDVRHAREALDRAFEHDGLSDPSRMCSTEVLRYESIWRWIFEEPVVRSLRAALGPELYYQNDLHVQRNSYGQAGLQRHRGWHMDAGSETDQSYLREPHYRFAKCGIYLQDFDNGWGGGIRVKRKSHRKLAETRLLNRGVFAARRALNRIAITLRVDLDTLELPTAAGDFCFFDSRLLHSSVLPSARNVRSLGYHQRSDVGSFWPDIPKQHTKYVLYWDACNRGMVDDFLRNSIERARSETEERRQRSSLVPAFTQFLSVHYPTDYPRSFVQAAESLRIGIATLDPARARFHRHKLEAMHAEAAQPRDA